MATKSVVRKLLLAALLTGASFGIQAATIDFSGVQGSQASPLVLPEATLTNLTGTTILVGPGAAAQVDGFCFLDAGGGSCEADGEIVFAGTVTNLTFDVDGFNVGDAVLIEAFNGAILVGAFAVVGDGNVDFSAFGSITSLSFDDSSTGAGVGYSTFTFDTAAVPEPATIALLGLGLLGFGFTRRRRD